jgi:hypothetical protein
MVEAVAAQEFVWAALFDDAADVHDNDRLGVVDGGQPCATGSAISVKSSIGGVSGP